MSDIFAGIEEFEEQAEKSIEGLCALFESAGAKIEKNENIKNNQEIIKIYLSSKWKDIRESSRGRELTNNYLLQRMRIVECLVWSTLGLDKKQYEDREIICYKSMILFNMYKKGILPTKMHDVIKTLSNMWVNRNDYEPCNDVEAIVPIVFNNPPKDLWNDIDSEESIKQACLPKNAIWAERFLRWIEQDKLPAKAAPKEEVKEKEETAEGVLIWSTPNKSKAEVLPKEELKEKDEPEEKEISSKCKM